MSGTGNDVIPKEQISFSKWINNRMYSDLQFYIGEKKVKFYCHKFILYAASPFFKSLLRSKQLSEVIYTEIDPNSFYEVLYFIYTKTLSQRLSGKNVGEVNKLAQTFELDLLKQLCMTYIGENSQQFLLSSGFLEMEMTSLIELLENPYLSVEESIIASRCTEWAEKRDNPLILMKKLLPCLRLTLLPLSHLEKLEEKGYLDQETLLSTLKKIYTKKYEDYRFALRFVHATDFDQNGILYFLGSKEKTQIWTNPATAGYVTVSVVGQTNIYGTLNDICGRANSNTWLGANKSSAFQIDFGAYRVQITDYTWKHFTQTCCYPRYWNFECSNDGITWDIIQSHTEPTNASLSQPNQTHTFNITTPSKVFYKHIRLHNVNQNSSNWNFGIGCLEFYGSVRRVREE
jgi:hypothetical protein